MKFEKENGIQNNGKIKKKIENKNEIKQETKNEENKIMK